MRYETRKSRTGKAGLMAALLLVLLLGLTACGGGSDGMKDDMDTEALVAAIQEAEPDLAIMDMATDQDEDPDTSLAAVTDVDADKVEHFLIYYSSEGKADEVVVLDCKNESAAKDASDSFEDHVNSRSALFEQYAPAEVSKVNNAQWEQKGHYAILVISDHPDEVIKAIEDSLAE